MNSHDELNELRLGAKRDERTQRRREEEAEEAQVLRRLSSTGRSLQALAAGLKWNGGTVGVGAVCRRLRDRDRAHSRDGLWFAGPAPDNQASGPGTLRVARRRRTTKNGEMSYVTSLRARLLNDITDHPGAKAAEIASRMGLAPVAISPTLQFLRTSGRLRREGARSKTRWWLTEPLSPPSEPSGPAAEEAPLRVVGETPEGGDNLPAQGSAELIDQLLDWLKVPAHEDRRVRIGMCAGMYRDRERG